MKGEVCFKGMSWYPPLYTTLVTSYFSLSHSVFYRFEELSHIFIKFEIVVCKLLQFGRVYNLSFGKGLMHLRKVSINVSLHNLRRQTRVRRFSYCIIFWHVQAPIKPMMLSIVQQNLFYGPIIIQCLAWYYPFMNPYLCGVLLDTIYLGDTVDYAAFCHNKSMGECNTILSAYTLYRHLGRCCTHVTKDIDLCQPT